MNYAEEQMESLKKGFDWVNAITGTGREIYDNVKGTTGGNMAPAPAPPAPKAPLNWKPWAIGGGVILLIVVVVKVVFGKKSK